VAEGNGRFFFFLCLAAQSVDEGCVGEHTVLILGVAELGQQLLHILLGDLVAQVGEDVLQLGQHHRAVVVLVVELEELDVVVVVAGGLGGVLGLLHLGDDIVEFAELLALLVCLSQLDAHLRKKGENVMTFAYLNILIYLICLNGKIALSPSC
jgi:hypothetical protein